MAFFGLTDLKFKNPASEQRTYKGKILNDSYYVYPLNLGSLDRGHYVMFHLNEYTMSHDATTRTTAQKNSESLATQGKSNAGTTQSLSSAVKAGAELSGFGTETENTDPNQSAAETARLAAAGTDTTKTKFKNLLDQSKQIASDSFNKILNPSMRYSRTVQSIALYMPNTLQFDYSQRYNDVSGTSALGKVGFAVQGASNLLDSGTGKTNLQNMVPFVGELGKNILGNLGGAVGDGFGDIALQAAFDVAINPQVELLYSHPDLRTFDFNFQFYPSSVAEYIAVDNIIRLFKYNSAPELKSGTNGRYFTPPGSFDIEFYYNGETNKNIPKISTCVLETIQVNYAPNGFSALEVNPGEPLPNEKGDGAPSYITLTLRFREMEIITKDHLDDRGVLSDDGNIY